MFGIQCALPTTIGKTTKFVSLCIMANRKSVNTVVLKTSYCRIRINFNLCLSKTNFTYTISIACFLKDLVFNNATVNVESDTKSQFSIVLTFHILWLLSGQLPESVNNHLLEINHSMKLHGFIMQHTSGHI